MMYTEFMILIFTTIFFYAGIASYDSGDFSQAEKERTSCKAEKIHKMTTIFPQNGPRLSF